MPASTPLLTLRITRAVAHLSAQGQTRVFDERGGTIGRAAGNDWILPDPSRVLSAHHATIYFEQGHYRLVDCSTNGVFVNDETVPLGAGRIAALRDGDRLQLGDYEVSAKIAAAEAHAPLADAMVAVASPAIDPMQLLEAASSAPLPALAPPAPAATPAWLDARPAPIALASTPSAVVDPLLLLGGAGHAPPTQGGEDAAARDDAPALAGYFQPPVVAAPVPVDWFATGIAMAPLPHAPIPARAAEPSSAAPVAPTRPAHANAGDDLQSAAALLLRAAGLDADRAARLDPRQTLTTAGALLREALSALREMLIVRARARNELGLPAKFMQAQGNNPLEFCPRGVEQAIDMLLFDDGPACLGAIDAVREALRDLKAGRDEELASVRQQAADTLDRLAPAAIEQACDATPRLRFLAPGPTACWTLYKVRHAEARAALLALPHPASRRATATTPIQPVEAAHGLA